MKNKILLVGTGSQLIPALLDRFQDYLIDGIFHHTPSQDTRFNQHYSFTEIPDLEDTYSTVIISAAYLGNSNLNQLWSSNIQLVIDCVLQFPSAKHIFFSSTSVYAPSSLALNETSQLAANTEYEYSKIAGENIISSCDTYAIIRLPSIISRLSKHNFIQRAVREALTTNTVTIFGNGNRQQNYVTDQDIATVTQATLTAPNGVYLAVNNTSFSNLQVAQEIQSQLNKVKIVHTGEDNSPSQVFAAASTTRILTESISTTLQELVALTIKHEQAKL